MSVLPSNSLEKTIFSLDSERHLAAHVIRRASLKADELTIADDTNLSTVATRLREIGIYLEGLEFSIAPPFRLRSISPNMGQVNMTSVAMDVYVDGSVEDTAVIVCNNTAQSSTSFIDFSHLHCVIPNLGPNVRVVKVWVTQGTWRSNEMNFSIVPAVGP